MSEINYTLIMVTAFFALVSPGPDTLAIAGTSLNQGRLKGSVLAAGITTGTLIWSCSAAFGLGAVMYANAWLFEVIRYMGAGYILFLAYKAAQSALKNKSNHLKTIATNSYLSAYYRGLTINITNPKALLFFASLYSIAIPHGTNLQELLFINVLIVSQGFIVYQAYAFIFSVTKIRNFYMRMSRWFDAFFAVAFGFAGLKVLTLKLS